MPEPTPTPPTPASDQKWWEEFLPNNWKKIVSWLVLALLITLVNWVARLAMGESAPHVPIPNPLPLFDIVVDHGDLTEEQIEELRRRNIRVRCTGWVPPTDAQRQDALESLAEPRFRDTEAGRAILGDGDAPVWRLAFKGRGRPIPDRDQGQVGSCVSFGYAAAVEYTMAVQVALGRARQELPDIAQEPIYAGSRVEVNGGRVPFRGDGSTGAWGAKWLEKVGGALARGQYGTHDLTSYNVSRCKQWGDRGVPDELEPLARRHQAKCTLVASAQEAKKALQQGYAISVCSNQGFATTRDAQGFCRPQGQWAHCMCIIGYREDKPGFLILNSWGSDWVRGPKGPYEDIPDGSFWADSQTVDRMLRNEDSYAVANAEGFVKKKIDWTDWVVRKDRPRVFEPLFALAP